MNFDYSLVHKQKVDFKQIRSLDDFIFLARKTVQNYPRGER